MRVGARVGTRTRARLKLKLRLRVTFQSKLEPSVMMPPIEVPWPPTHLVADSTMMSAPNLSGRQVYPPMPNVLSCI